MRLIQTKDYDTMSEYAANIIKQQIREKENTVLGLATGSSPAGIYKNLVKACEEGSLSMEKVMGFGLDEYMGIEKSCKQSFYSYLMKNLVEGTNFRKENLHVLDGMADDIQQSCNEYEDKINRAGGIDLQILGIGETGHVGFNEPDVFFSDIPHCVRLEEETRRANSRFFDSLMEVPEFALTMGIGTIMRARKILMVVSGFSKASVLEKMIYGRVTPQVPASILQFHRDVTVIADEAASSVLNGRSLE